jgi:glycosyltransferase involved in cell wall biosynthesis
LRRGIFLSATVPNETTLNKLQQRTLNRKSAMVSVVIPAHNEAETIADVVADCRRGLDLLQVSGQVLVGASGCTDDTAQVAKAAGATVVEAPIGKGAAIMAGVAATDGDIICLVDGDLRYYGETPLVTILVEPILHGIADASIANLYWRPIYPDQWMYGFFAPLGGYLFPELLPKSGSTPWSGQRAAARELWPTSLPNDFTSDLALVLHWNDQTSRLRPVLTDDWYNPLRPKPEQIRLDFNLLVRHGLEHGVITAEDVAPLRAWFDVVQEVIDSYRDGIDDPSEHERSLLRTSLAELRRRLLARPTESRGRQRSAVADGS